MASACPDCGFDSSSVSPGDAVVALRSFPRRFRAAGDPTGREDEEPSADVPGPEQDRRHATAATEAGQAADALAELGADLRAVLVEDDPRLATVEGTATTVRSGGDPRTAFDRLASAAENVAALAADQPGTAWTRSGVRATGPISAADLLREAVHAGVHHLRVAESDPPH